MKPGEKGSEAKGGILQHGASFPRKAGTSQIEECWACDGSASRELDEGDLLVRSLRGCDHLRLVEENRRNVLGFLMNDFATLKGHGCKDLHFFSCELKAKVRKLNGFRAVGDFCRASAASELESLVLL